MSMSPASIGISVLVTALTGLGLATKSVNDYNESVGATQGKILSLILLGANSYMEKNRAVLTATNGKVGNVDTPLAPTVAELRTLNYLAPGVPSTPNIPTSAAAAPQYRIVIEQRKTNPNDTSTGCPPSSCNLVATVYIDQPVVDNMGQQFGLNKIAAAASRASNGLVGMSLPTSPGFINGSTWKSAAGVADVRNRVNGNPAGVLLATTSTVANEWSNYLPLGGGTMTLGGSGIAMNGQSLTDAYLIQSRGNVEAGDSIRAAFNIYSKNAAIDETLTAKNLIALDNYSGGGLLDAKNVNARSDLTVGGNLSLKGILTNTAADSNILMIDSKGKVFKSPSSIKQFTTLEYNLDNGGNGDWIADYDTKIPASDYTMIISGWSFNNFVWREYSIFGAGDYAAAGDSTAPAQVFASKKSDAGEPATWRITADWKGARPADGACSDPTRCRWSIKTMVFANDMVVDKGCIRQNFAGATVLKSSENPLSTPGLLTCGG